MYENAGSRGKCPCCRRAYVASSTWFAMIATVLSTLSLAFFVSSFLV
jgi:hypothetical protein